MTIRSLEFLFKPDSVALIGASRRPGSVGALVSRNLFNSGFAGPILPINPNYNGIEGVITYPDIRSLPIVPDLAVIATPAETVPGLVAELSERGTRAPCFRRARMTQIDYDRDMALVLAEPGIPGKAQVYAVASIAADPDGEKAEYAIMVLTDMTTLGLGSLLTGRIIEYCRRRGFKEIFAEVLRENRPMLRICDDLAFCTRTSPSEPNTAEVRLTL